MKALRVYVRPQNEGYGLDYHEIVFERYRGLIGRLCLEKVIPPDHLLQSFYIQFNSLDDIAADVVETARFGYEEVHISAGNPYRTHMLKKKIQQVARKLKVSSPIRKFAMGLEQFLRIFRKRDDYFKNIRQY